QEQINGSKKQTHFLPAIIELSEPVWPTRRLPYRHFEPVRSLRHWRIYAATRVHIATWRRGGGMAARGARAAAGEAADHWFLGRDPDFGRHSVDRRFCA